MQHIIDQVVTKIKDGVTPDIVSVYEGDPIAVPAASLPCIYVEASGSESQVGPTGMDENFYTIVIGVIIDKRSEISRDPSTSPIQKKLLDLVEGRESDGTYKADSLFGIMRKNFTLSSKVTNQMLKVDYGIGRRGEGNEMIITAEARIEARVSELVIVTSRS